MESYAIIIREFNNAKELVIHTFESLFFGSLNCLSKSRFGIDNDHTSSQGLVELLIEYYNQLKSSITFD